MKKIFLVNNDQNFSKNIHKVLKNNGFKVVAESSGNKAYKLLKIENFDLIILDIYVPGMNGLDLLRFLNKESELTGKKRIPAIIVTEDLSHEIEIKARSQNVSMFMIKPLSPEILLTAVQNIIG